MACMTASGPAAKRPPHCKALAGELLLSFKKFGPGLSRRALMAAVAGLAAGGAGGECVGDVVRTMRGGVSDVGGSGAAVGGGEDSYPADFD